MKIAITGHRPNKLDNDYELTSPLAEGIRFEIGATIDRLLKEKHLQWSDLVFISGMALGVDTLFALIAVHKNIPFIAAVPCASQPDQWPERSRKKYKTLLALAKQVHTVAFGYSAEVMQKRNEWMVDNCDLIIAVWDGSTGGTCNCIRYAQKVGKELIIIDLDDCRMY